MFENLCMRDFSAYARTQTREPEFMAVITGNGEYARKMEDGIYMIPLRALTW